MIPRIFIILTLTLSLVKASAPNSLPFFVQTEGAALNEPIYNLTWSGGSAIFEGDKIRFYYFDHKASSYAPDASERSLITEEHTLNMIIHNKNPLSIPLTSNPTPTRVNRFKGNDPTLWQRDLPTYSQIEYPEIYPGISALFYIHQGELKYDWIVNPGADYSCIEWGYEGADSLMIGEAGELLVYWPGGILREEKPTLYQNIGGVIRPVDGCFVLNENRNLRYQIPNYDPKRILVIDPTLSGCTYLGGSGDDRPMKNIKHGSNGDIYVSGMTWSAGLTGSNPPYDTQLSGSADAFIARYSADLTILKSLTYLGGSADEGYKYAGNPIAIADNGNVYITGTTYSSDFPVTPGCYQSTLAGSNDFFVACLNSDLNTLNSATYLGGSGYDYGMGIDIDNDGNIVLSGVSQSSNYPTANIYGLSYQTIYGGGQDGVVTILYPCLTGLIASTYLGSANFDVLWSVDCNANGIYVCGGNIGGGFPMGDSPYDATQNGDRDAVVACLNNHLTGLVNSTYLGGSAYEQALFVHLGSDGQVWVCGDTDSPDYPITAGSYRATPTGKEAYVTGLNSSLSQINSSTFIGGSSNEGASYVTTAANNDVWVSGGTNSTDFCVTENAWASIISGAQDGFIAQFNNSLTQGEWITYFGGELPVSVPSGDNEEEVNGILIVNSNVYICGTTTSTTEFPITAGASQAVQAGMRDGFVAWWQMSSTPTLSPPVVQNITSSGASASSSVTDDGGSAITERGFVYGTSPTPTTSSGTKQSVAGTTGAFSANLTNLTPHTLYYLRAYATNSLGTAYSAETQFTTALALPTVTTQSATNISQTLATLRGSVNPSGGSATVWFEWGATSSYGNTAAATPATISGNQTVSVTSPLTNLQPHTTYHYRINATNEASSTVHGSDMTFTTLENPAVSLLSPLGGEIWESTTLKTIRWVLTELSGPVSIYFSRHAGANYQLLTTADKQKNSMGQMVRDTGSWVWSIPDSAVSDSCRIKVVFQTDTTYQSASTANFRITPRRTLTLIAPAAGNYLYNGGPVSIQWQSAGEIDTLRIDYRAGLNQSWQTITASTPNDGDYLWQIPSGIRSATCFLRLRDAADSTISATNSAPFIIHDTLRIVFIKPDSTTRYIAGEADSITWQTNGYAPQIQLYSRADSTAEFSELTSLITNNSGYQWQIPTQLGTTWQLQITTPTDPSNGFHSPLFTIAYPIEWTIAPRLTFLSDQKARLRWETDRPVFCRFYYRQMNETWLESTPQSSNNRYFSVDLEQLEAGKSVIYYLDFLTPENFQPCGQTAIDSFSTLSFIPEKQFEWTVKPRIEYLGSDRTLIAWETDRPQIGRCRLIDANGDSLIEESSDTAKMEHRVLFTHLMPGHTYTLSIGNRQPAIVSIRYSVVDIPFKTLPLEDTRAPMLMEGAHLITDTHRISMRFRFDEACEGKIYLYYRGTLIDSVVHSEYRVDHSFIFSRLRKNTRYSAEGWFTDPAGNTYQWRGQKSLFTEQKWDLTAMSGNEFSTSTTADSSAPRFNSLPYLIVAYDSIAIIRWKTNEPAGYSLTVRNSNQQLVYAKESPDYLPEQMPILHYLEPISSYTVGITIFDFLGNESEATPPLQFATQGHHEPTIIQSLPHPPQTIQTDDYFLFQWQTPLPGTGQSCINLQPQQANGYWYFEPDFTLDHLLIVYPLPIEGDAYQQLQTDDYFGQIFHQSDWETISAESETPPQLQFDQTPYIAYASDRIIRVDFSVNRPCRAIAEIYFNGENDLLFTIAEDNYLTDHQLLFNPLTPDREYTIRIFALLPEGTTIDTTISAITPNAPDTIAPSPPEYLNFELINRNIQITWQAVQDIDLQGYAVFRQDALGMTYPLCSLTPDTIWSDPQALSAGCYQYGVVSIDLAGNKSDTTYSSSWMCVDDVDEADKAINRSPLALLTNYPNPFNQLTQIVFSLNYPADVELSIYDLKGQCLFRQGLHQLPAGVHRFSPPSADWPSGIYLLRAEIPAINIIKQRKMMLMK